VKKIIDMWDNVGLFAITITVKHIYNIYFKSYIELLASCR